MNARKKVFRTPYFTIWEVPGQAFAPAEDDSPYYAVEPPDYVCVVAMTRGGEILLVRQFRPVVGERTLELPAGCVDPGETPEVTARRELLEETGYTADEFTPLGALLPDTGRLCNLEWCFFAHDVRRAAAPIEQGIETIVVPASELDRMVARGELRSALHLAALHTARAQGLLPQEPCSSR
ncbi:MAG: NUDIX hydrolase [Desulfovibrionaceae bacterium]